MDGPTGDDASLRPNQIFALALDDQLVTDAQAKQVLQLMKERLLTPVGLRTLAPKTFDFAPRMKAGFRSGRRLPSRDRMAVSPGSLRDGLGEDLWRQ